MNNCGLIDPSQKTSSKINKLAIIFMAVLSLSTANHILANDWTFEKITDSTELADYGISSYMRIDAFDIADGNVAFSAYDSIFKSIDGQLIEVVNGNTVLPGAGNLYESARSGSYHKFFSFDGSNVLFAAGPTATWGGVEGVYTDKGGCMQVVLNTDTLVPGTDKTFSNFLYPVFLNNSYAFYSAVETFSSELSGIYKYVNDDIVPVATNAMSPSLPEGQRWGISAGSLIFNGESIAYTAYICSEHACNLSDRYQAILSDIDDSLAIIADTETMVPGYNGTYGRLRSMPLANESQIVFHSTAKNSGQHLGFNISRYNEQGLSVIIDEHTLVPGSEDEFYDFELLTISEKSVYFVNEDDSDDDEDYGYYRANDDGIFLVTTQLQALADGSGYAHYLDRGGPTANFQSSDEMTVYTAFYSPDERLSINDVGLYYSIIDEEVLPIVKPGDTLDGNVVDTVGFEFETDFINKQVVFTVEFENGNKGIYLATIPEPTTAALFTLVTFSLIHRRG